MLIKVIKIIKSLSLICLFKISYGGKIKISSLKTLFGKGNIIDISRKGKLCFEGDISFRNYNSIKITSGKIIIGKNVFFNNFCSLNCQEEIKIGDDCLFGENMKIYDHDHRFRDTKKLIKDQGFKMKKVEIGNNVWIGSNVVILKGSKIEDNVVISCGCIISGRIEKGSLVTQSRELKIKKIGE